MRYVKSKTASVPEFKHVRNRDGAKYMQIDENGICDACNQAEAKKSIDWDEREDQLKELLDKYRSKDGSYDCLVPGSGGKDSVFQAHIKNINMECILSPVLGHQYYIQITGMKTLKIGLRLEVLII